jgi:hypothetical protein
MVMDIRENNTSVVLRILFIHNGKYGLVPNSQ